VIDRCRGAFIELFEDGWLTADDHPHGLDASGLLRMARRSLDLEQPPFVAMPDNYEAAAHALLREMDASEARRRGVVPSGEAPSPAGGKSWPQIRAVLGAALAKLQAEREAAIHNEPRDIVARIAAALDRPGSQGRGGYSVDELKRDADRWALESKALLREASEEIATCQRLADEAAAMVAEGVEEERARLVRLARAVGAALPAGELPDDERAELEGVIAARFVELEARILELEKRNRQLRRSKKARRLLERDEDEAAASAEVRTALRRRLTLAAANGDPGKLRDLARALEAFETAEAARAFPGLAAALWEGTR